MKNENLFEGAIVETRVSGDIVRCRIVSIVKRPVNLYSRHSMAPSYGHRIVTRYRLQRLDNGRELPKLRSGAAIRRVVGWPRKLRDVAIAHGHRPAGGGEMSADAQRFECK